jgi:hypothetical protein
MVCPGFKAPFSLPPLLITIYLFQSPDTMSSTVSYLLVSNTFSRI